MFYCCCRCSCWTPPTNFNEAQKAKNCNEISTACWSPWSIPWKKKKQKLQQSKRLSYHFFEFCFYYLWPVIHFTVVRVECVTVCVCVRVWEVVVHDVTAEKTGLQNKLAFRQRSQQQSRKSFKWHYTQMKRKQHALSCHNRKEPDRQIPCTNTIKTSQGYVKG